MPYLRAGGVKVRAEAPTCRVDVTRLRAALDVYEEAYRSHEENPCLENALLVEVALGVLQAIK